MVFSYNWLKDYVKNMPRPEKLAELLTMHFAEVEEVKKARNDYVLDIDVRPNRAADCFSHLGIAREISAIIGSKLQLPLAKVKVSAGVKTGDFVKVEVKDKRACPRYVAKVVVDVKVGPSPKWLQERLKVCGLRPINNIVDIANYVMIETGQPLHAFDSDKLKGGKIQVRLAKKGESIVTLDEDKFDLEQSILVIADEQKPVAIAGIKGGKEPEIDKKTRAVIVEAANFNPRIIRKASKKIGLRTDASLRFEHGLDPNLAEFAVNRAAYLIQKVARGKAGNDFIDIYSQKSVPSRIKLDLNYLNNLLGLAVPKTKAAQILKKLDFKIIKESQKSLLVEVPTSRQDVSLPEDLIEEIGRIYGYEKIPVAFPEVSLIPGKRNDRIFWENAIKDILKEAGFVETYSYSFVGDKEAKIFKYKNDELIEVQNPISLEQKYLRPSLIPNLLAAVKKNTNNFSDIRIFELGKVFEKAMASKDKSQLTGAAAGRDFYELKGVVDLLLHKLGISEIWYDDYKAIPEQSKISIWHPKKCAEIKIDGTGIGFLGEISPKLLQQLEMPEKMVVFDIDAEALIDSVSWEHEFRPISKFPAVVRDLAVLVPRKVKVADVLNKINSAGGGLVRDVDIFDIYEGNELPGGKKNLAFHIIYQAEDRTLKSDEVDKVQQKIIKALEKSPSWQVRK